MLPHPAKVLSLLTMSTQMQKSSSGPRERGRVFLLTDNQTKLSPELFDSAGLNVVGIASGTAALVSMQRARPHLVIASNRIEGISVEEIGRILSHTHKGVFLLIVGAEEATSGRRQSALAHGAFDYFQLPAESDLLILRAKQLVGLQQTLERLRAEADLDSLTGLANRRRFRTALDREVERWRRYGVPCALLLIDIDHMKAINDRFGHPAGDVVIRDIGSLLADVSRDTDTAARLGGEEFALLLANVTGEKAAFAAERLRLAINGLVIPEVGSISVSIGVAALPEHAHSPRSLYAASDRALYVAKNGGRNRVSIAPLLQENLPGV